MTRGARRRRISGWRGIKGAAWRRARQATRGKSERKTKAAAAHQRAARQAASSRIAWRGGARRHRHLGGR